MTRAVGPALLAEIMRVDGVRMGVNYGLNKVRFPAQPAARWHRRRKTHAIQAVIDGLLHLRDLHRLEMQLAKQ